MPPSTTKKSILKRPLRHTTTPSNPPRSALLQFSDEEGDAQEHEESRPRLSEEDYSPVKSTFKRRRTPEQASASMRAKAAKTNAPLTKPRVTKELPSEDLEPLELPQVEATISRFAHFAPTLNFPTAPVPMIQSSPIRTPSRNLRKTILPAFAEILKSPIRPHDGEANSLSSLSRDFSSNENVNSGNYKICFETPTKARFLAFSSPPRMATPNVQWTPASERKKAGSLLPESVHKQVLESKFVDDDLDVESMEGSPLIDDQVLAEGYIFFIFSISISPDA